MINDIIARGLFKYKNIFNAYRKRFNDLPNDTFISDYNYCFWLACIQYHPDDDRFLEYFIILLDAQLKKSQIENARWI